MGNKLLLADDSITIQKVVGIIFANEDYELTVVDNGDAALEKAREIRPDVMLVDALMPGKSGYEVCAEVRRNPLLKEIPLLIMTGAFEPFDETKARENGADDFISKPFESQQLIDKVKALIELGGTRGSAAPGAEPAIAVSAENVAAPSADAMSIADAFEFPVGDQTETFADLEPVAVVESPAVGSSFAVEVEEVSSADDLWGTFDLEETAEEEIVEFGEVVEEGDGLDEVVDAAPFALPAEEPEAFGVVALDVQDVAPDQFGVPVPESEFVFASEPETGSFGSFGDEESFGVLTAEEPAVSETSFAAEPIAGFDETFTPAFEEPVMAASPPVSVEAPDLQFAPGEEYAPATVAAVPVVEAAAPVSVISAPGTITLTEEQLAAAISRISKEIIERIAWEVVPDLAEALIREEIRRIKEVK